ncbi:gp53-like domain-containing protein [Polaromonas sp. JS666]|uniref:gp53-like domain-containing protein n=1 Tax=Polaromonas sp. (strain JS666 / ATCC BAA-500) TaxID=296591 RepID=UPI0000464B6C|nr:hypothetical protein [Polaromonas sp. JS666]ABE45630.1 tail fiber protein, putative [Polaromonas sp. JS666]
MDRINTASKAVDLFGAGKHGWKNANLGLGVTPTDFNAEFCNGVQEEILAIIEAGGQVPAIATRNQMLLALRAAGVFTTPAQFDNTTKAATTAFVQRALGNYQDAISVAANTVLTAADFGKVIFVDASGGPRTITLPLVTQSGAALKIYKSDSSANAVTVVTSGSNVIVGTNNFAGGTSSSSVILRTVGDFLDLCATGGGSYYGLSSGGAASVAASGYQKLPSGLIIQWGVFTGNATPGNPVAVTFPLTFPTALYSLTFGSAGGTTATCAAWSDTQLLTGFNGRASIASNSNYWAAIGK